MRGMVARILAERQFHPAPGLWQRVINWILDHLNLDLRVGNASGPGSWLNTVVLVVLIAGALTLVVVAVRKGVFTRLRHPRDSGVVVTEEGEVLAPEAWRREADRLAAEGRFREALRCRYRALVAELASRGVLDEVPGRTSGDYERLVVVLLPEVASQFSTITRLFERCWYGHEPSDAAAQVSFDAMAAAIVERLGSGRWPRRPEPELAGLK